MKEIKLTKGLVAWVDEEDFERINSNKWCASIESNNRRVYAVRRIRDHSKPREKRLVTIKNKQGKRVRVMKWYYPGIKIKMHREVLNLPHKMENNVVVHHINDDGLDNCKDNLEVMSQAENMRQCENWYKRKSEQPSL